MSKGYPKMLPSIVNYGAARCQGKSKRTGLPCRNVAAYKSRCCRLHGAVPKPLSGKDHPNYKNGWYTKAGIEEYRSAKEALKGAALNLGIKIR
jgi:hypothetical protein